MGAMGRAQCPPVGDHPDVAQLLGACHDTTGSPEVSGKLPPLNHQLVGHLQERVLVPAGGNLV